jgi:hypothetical protein
MICVYDKCNNEFEPKTHNQKYCSDECCSIATNEKLKKQYYEKKARLSGVERKCSTKGCNVILTRYNSTSVCNKCVGAKKELERKSLIEMVKRVSG